MGGHELSLGEAPPDLLRDPLQDTPCILHAIVNRPFPLAVVEVGQEWRNNGEGKRKAAVHILTLQGWDLGEDDAVGGHLHKDNKLVTGDRHSPTDTNGLLTYKLLNRDP